MTATNSFPGPLFKAFTSSGTLGPLSGGKVYTYLAGTSTPATTYQDPLLTVPHANPIVLDTYGQALIYLGSSPYKITLTDSTGNIQPGWPVDGVIGDAVATLRSDLASTSTTAMGDALVGVLQPLAGAAATTQHAKNLETVSLGDFGAAVGTSTADTALFQYAISTGKNLYSSDATYAIGAVNAAYAFSIYGAATVKTSGANGGIEIKGTVDNVKIDGIRFVGDATVGNLNRAIWSDATRVLRRIWAKYLHVKDMIQGIDGSTVDTFFLLGNSIERTRGTGAGQGYGAVFVGDAKNITAVGNVLNDNDRHSIYMGKTVNATVTGNVFYRHGYTVAGGPGSNSALVLSRSKCISVVGNTFLECQSSAVLVDSDSNATRLMESVTITGNVFRDTNGQDIRLGTSAATNPLYNIASITITGNNFYPLPTAQYGQIGIKSGKTIVINGNTWHAPDQSAAGNSYAIYIDATGDPTGAAGTVQDISICNNSGIFKHATTSSYFIWVPTAICTGTDRLKIFNNDVEVSSNGLIAYEVRPTNPNIRTDWGFQYAQTLAAGAQTLNVAGYNNFVITGNGAGSSITDFANGYEGKIINLRFVDAFTTITRGNAWLAGGVNFVSSDRDVMSLIQRSGVWVELSRSVNA